MTTSVLRISILFLIALGTFQFHSCKEDTKTIKPVVVEFKKEGELLLKTTNDSLIKQIDIEIADDEYHTQTGLMYRDSMDEQQGMLFVFPDEEQRAFYMKNTKIPLDIIYIDANKVIVSFQKNAEPYSEASLPSNLPAQYVLEINAGLADQWQLNIGDKIEYTAIK